MRLVKTKQKGNKTWEDKNGKEHPYYNYFLELDNGKRICVRATFSKDTKLLDTICEYEG